MMNCPYDIMRCLGEILDGMMSVPYVVMSCPDEMNSSVDMMKCLN